MPKLVNPLARKKTPPNPFSTLQRRKPSNSSKTATRKSLAADQTARLEDTGLIPSLTPKGVRQDVISLIRWIQENTWDAVPEVAGMGSERISEVLRFRAAMPPIVSLRHLFAIARSATEVERELAMLVARGVVRRVIIPGRGKGGGSVGEGVALVEDWVERVRKCEALTEETKDGCIILLKKHTGVQTTSTAGFERPEVQTLVQEGFLTNPAATANGSLGSGLFTSPGTSQSLLYLSSAGSTAPSGTLAAIGGAGAIHETGGGGSTLATQTNRPTGQSQSPFQQTTMTLSLPGTGAYLKHLTSSLAHLQNLLKQLSPKHKECTLDLLKEKWEGNVLGDANSMAKRARGERTGVLPGKTRKWREFLGARFDWVLAEAVGGGMVEVFETGVGVLGVRAR